jgi:hypothetical protein
MHDNIAHLIRKHAQWGKSNYLPKNIAALHCTSERVLLKNVTHVIM